MNRAKELDSLRGLAALGIVFYHLWFPKLLFGWTRVDFFFVVSGYLITGIGLRKSGEPGSYGRGLIRRAMRLVPPYAAALLLVVTINPFLAHPSPMTALPYYLTFTQNFATPWGRDTAGFSPAFQHTWSLALELQFSILWPPLVARLGRRRLLALCPLLALLGAFARSRGVSPCILPGRCDGFALGALLAAWLHDDGSGRGTIRVPAAPTIGAGLAALAVIVGGMAWHWPTLKDAPMPWPGPGILAVCVAYTAMVGLVVRWSGHPALRVLRWRGLVALGTISYGLYLFHPLAIKGVEVVGRSRGIDRGFSLEILAIPASLLVAALSWRLLERPLSSLVARPAGGGPASPRPMAGAPASRLADAA